MIMISPSVMCADFLHLERDIKAMEGAKVDFLHIDIMDGHFVPNLSLNFDIIRQIRSITTVPLDIHLMVEKPEWYIDKLELQENDLISFHWETTHFPLRLINEIKKYTSHVGIAVNPSTPVANLDMLVEELGFILIMTVDPGFAGQKFIQSMAKKIAEAKEMILSNYANTLIQVDGNISNETAKVCVNMGADILVAGTSGVFKKNTDLKNMCEEWKQLVNRF